MNPEINHTLARQRAAELRRAAERTRLASEVRGTRPQVRASQLSPEPRASGFMLRGHDLAKLDRFVGQAARAAVRADREFEGVSVEIDAQGVVRVHASGMTSMVL